MGNQQVDVDLYWLGCFLDAEGCIRIDKVTFRHGRIRLNPEIVITGMDVNLMNVACNLMRRRGIAFHVSPNLRHRPRPIYRLEIKGLNRCSRLLDLLYPTYLVAKKKEAALLLKWIATRRRGKEEWRLGRGVRKPYTEQELQIDQLLRAEKANIHLRDLEPHGVFLGDLEDIVQPFKKLNG